MCPLESTNAEPSRPPLRGLVSVPRRQSIREKYCGEAEESLALLQLKTTDRHRWIRLIPLHGERFIAELKVALIMWGQRDGIGAEQPLLISQDHLIERIVEFQSDLDLANRTRTVI